MYSIGWSSRDITPSRPALLQGQMHVRIASSAMDPLTLTALVIEKPQGECAILVSCDLAYISNSLLTRIRQLIHKSQPDFPTAQIVLNATHTHDSLVFDGDFYAHPGGNVMTADECEAWLADHAVIAILDAWNNRKPHRLGHAYGHAVIGHNRYAVYANGIGQMYGATNREDFDHIGGYTDHSLDMFFTWDATGVLTGVALAIPCPSQVDEHLIQFSADFWHEIRVDLRARFGAHLQIFPICSAAGDQSPHFLLYSREEAEMRRRRGLTERQIIARKVGDAVEQALTCTPPIAESAEVFEHSIRKIKLTGLKITRDQCRWAEAQLASWRKNNTDEESWYPRGLKRVIKSWKKKIPAAPFPVELHVVRLGDAVLASNPFELFLDYGLQIKARSPASQTVIMQLAGRGMYLPTAQALNAGGYGANPIVSEVGDVGGRELVEATLALIRKQFSPPGAVKERPARK
jgi:hypothetical protein